MFKATIFAFLFIKILLNFVEADKLSEPPAVIYPLGFKKQTRELMLLLSLKKCSLQTSFKIFFHF